MAPKVEAKASLSDQSCEVTDQVAIAIPQIEAKAKAKAKAKAAPVVIVPVVGEWTVVLQSLLVRGFLGSWYGYPSYNP